MFKEIALVCLDTDTGALRRYISGPGNTVKPRNTNQVDNWEHVKQFGHPNLADAVEAFRLGDPSSGCAPDPAPPPSFPPWIGGGMPA